MDYQIRRSNRKTIAIEVTEDGVLVRAPRHATNAEIERFLLQHRRWIDSRLQKQAAERTTALEEGMLSPSDLRDLAEEARAFIPARVAHYAPLIGVRPGRVTIRTQKTRWGSCSSKGNLNFNCLLMLTPLPVIDSIVVHELCHLKEMNHSRRFYDEVLRVFPDYQKWHRWLRQHGGAIMKRVNW